MGSTKYVRPRCLGTSQSVRATSRPSSAWWALVFHTFWPVTTHSSPSSRAVAVSPARSDPAPGSLNSWHHVTSPVMVGARNRSRTSSGPCSSTVGAASAVPTPSGSPTAPAAASPSATTSSAHRGMSRPPHRAGHDGVAHPAANSARRHSTSASPGSQCAATHDATSPATDSRLTGPTLAMGPVCVTAARTRRREGDRPRPPSDRTVSPRSAAAAGAAAGRARVARARPLHLHAALHAVRGVDAAGRRRLDGRRLAAGLGPVGVGDAGPLQQ